jgi:hypothetical protein
MKKKSTPFGKMSISTYFPSLPGSKRAPAFVADFLYHGSPFFFVQRSLFSSRAIICSFRILVDANQQIQISIQQHINHLREKVGTRTYLLLAQPIDQ